MKAVAWTLNQLLALERARLGFIARSRKGQTSVEYILMLAAIATLVIIFIAMFGKKFLGGFFSIVGMIVGTPAKKT